MISFDQNPSRVKVTLFHNRLKKWIQKMPKPAEISATDDSYALHVPDGPYSARLEKAQRFNAVTKPSSIL